MVDAFPQTTLEMVAMTKKRESLASGVTPRILFVTASEGLEERNYLVLDCRAPFTRQNLIELAVGGCMQR